VHSDSFRNSLLGFQRRKPAAQLHQAVGELQCSDEKYTEVPNYEATDLAIFAVSQMAATAKRFERLYYRLHNEAVNARTESRTA
jgi:hypothetical protein